MKSKLLYAALVAGALTLGCSDPEEKPKGVTLDRDMPILVGSNAGVTEYSPLRYFHTPSISHMASYIGNVPNLILIGGEFRYAQIAEQGKDDPKLDNTIDLETAKSLDKLIQERQQDARDEKLFEKWRDIATYLGSEDKQKSKFQLGPSYTFDNDTFVVKYRADTMFTNAELIRVTYKTKLVFEADTYESSETSVSTASGDIEIIRKKVTNTNVSAYVPGEWEEEFHNLLGQSREKKKEIEPKETPQQKNKKQKNL